MSISYRIDLTNAKELRYGENPHQKGWFLVAEDEADDALGLSKFNLLQGKELSYNNYLDADGALYAISQLGGARPACVVVKHTNPCGAALRDSLDAAFVAAWHEGDPLAAFGGIIAVNRVVDEPVAQKMVENFFEVLLAPSVTEDAKKVFAKKQNLRVLVNEMLIDPHPSTAPVFHKVRGGWLKEEADTKLLKKEELKIVTKTQPTDDQIDDLLFAWNICRASKSNTIVAAKNRTLIASGVGQQDRKRCCELCVMKGGQRLEGASAASDAFFPFRDGPDTLINAGIKAIIQPGGSIRDADTIAACDEAGVAMVYTGVRAFRH